MHYLAVFHGMSRHVSDPTRVYKKIRGAQRAPTGRHNPCMVETNMLSRTRQVAKSHTIATATKHLSAFMQSCHHATAAALLG